MLILTTYMLKLTIREPIERGKLIVQPILKEEAQSILEPYVDRIRHAVITAVNSYFQGPDYANTRFYHSPRTAASICHDHIVSEIKKAFEGVPGAYFTKRKGLFMLIIKDTVVLRFKKFNKNLLSNGIPTKQAIAFNLQDSIQLEFDNMPPDGLLHVGYVVNNLGTGIEGVYITYRYGNTNIWTWDVTFRDKADYKVAAQVTLPQVASTTKKRKVTAKRKDISAGDNHAVQK